MKKGLGKISKKATMNTKTKYERVYEKLCSGCPNEVKCHEECETCEDFDELLNKKNHSRKFEELTHIEKCEIYNMAISGHYYRKEILTKFNITKHTLRRVIYAIKYFLRTGTPKDL